MECTCGGNLITNHNIDSVLKITDAIAGAPPRHKKKRVQKKKQKAWNEKRARLAEIAFAISELKNPDFKCEKCGKISGFYSTVARNLIKVEPMPQGAIPFYARTS